MGTADFTKNGELDLLTLSRLRCSVRSYSPRPIERDKLEYILECARLAPSAVNFQPWVFMVIREEENRAKIHSCYKRDWIQSAPVFILVCGDHEQSWKRRYDGKDFCDVDVSIAIEHICLAAAEQEIGTCWICNFDAAKCSELFDLPAHIDPIAIVSMGYPEDAEVFVSTPKKRKPFNEVVKWEKF